MTKAVSIMDIRFIKKALVWCEHFSLNFALHGIKYSVVVGKRATQRNNSRPWFLYLMVAHFTMRTYRVNQACNLFKAFGYI